MLEISVLDDGPGVPSEAESLAGHGIANTRERLKTLYADRASLQLIPAQPSGTLAVLRLPYQELTVDRSVPRDDDR